MSYKRIVILFFLFCFFYSLNAYGCRYTIREIGFSDIGSLPYWLYIFTNSETPEKDISSINKLSRVFLDESNVKIKLVDVDKDTSSRAVDYLDNYNMKSFPSAVFVFPEGGTMSFSLNSPGRSFKESVWLLLEELVASSYRQSIKDELLKSYCVALVVEGIDKQANSKVFDEVKKAVSEIKMTFDQMPKEVNAPPAILVIPNHKAYDEEILLRSLGINKKETTKPSVSIIYGRGRIIGPVLQGEHITENKIYNLLAIVGADCECGLDNSWVLGRMIPLRWDLSTQSALAEYLGFDVENPRVKSEMSQILSLNPAPDNPFDPMESGLKLGYSEGKIKVRRSSGNVSKISAREIHKSFHQTKSSNNLVLRRILMGFGVILVLAIGVFLFIKCKR
ncbi:hypothetical protein AKJ55_00515 [candidate division MSBL1 archaeon SCGC-AAA382M17]|uniref:Thioredoxin domain-containing protein n=1 Tax=candidate division MSBL1 archaeon SCGC-AAA382M17 TaxID=1698284 RepID=A0ABR5TNH9_9EURY|nr:hypothetical protein AKJ55_00515 [candidate division MSBL1 archaeon SCGC-AAA382M17]